MSHITNNRNTTSTPQQKKALRMVGLILLFVAPLWFLGAGYLYRDACAKQQNWSRTEGTVLRLIPESQSGSKGRSSTVYYPLFSYVSADGKAYAIRSNHGSNPPAYKPGERVEVLFSPEAPDDALIDSFGALFFAPMVLAVLGASNFLLGFFLYYVGRRKAQVNPMGAESAQ